MKLHIEIRPGEGGEDARLLVSKQAEIYLRYAQTHGVTLSILEASPSWLLLAAEGSDAVVAPLLQEAGGHRWQRVPPTEKRGRVQTSTVTVAVLEAPAEAEWQLRDEDIEVTTTKDGGPGGQHRNKTESCVIMRHRPTGITAKASAKSQHQNRRVAREILEARVAEHYRENALSEQAAARKEQVGSGMRGDKIRTYRERDDMVVDHRTGRKTALHRVQAGQLELLRG